MFITSYIYINNRSLCNVDGKCVFVCVCVCECVCACVNEMK